MVRFFSTPRRYGYTLVELVVVATTLVVLTFLLVVNLNNSKSRARDIQRKADLDRIKKGLAKFLYDHEQYPADDNGAIAGCGSEYGLACDWGAFWGDESSASAANYYVKPLPANPAPGPQYRYHQTGESSFCLIATLESTSDIDVTNSRSQCELACKGVEKGITNYLVCPK